ncbi:response regulator transcription factor [Sinimarinibacterium sp. NLF-5-8]|uniref:response regulator n=1 Tax=Sinimarinibacterium sp. NLF-5-8 TaxID=2698684 RepID=UPI00192EAE84|nr:response regulator transcription factor [Sinimarinibacterium sp. NLF-5-8]
MTPNPINVMLVDDHAVVRMGFRMLLQGTPNIRICAEAEDGESALRLCAQGLPDVLVIDLTMPGIGGLEAISRLHSKYPELRILVLSAHEDTIHPRRALKAGAFGYLTKRSAAEELIQAITHIAAGQMYVQATLAQRMMVQQLAPEQHPVDILSAREFEVFVALAKGGSVNGIAETLHLSPRTVGTHLYNIKQKLKASNQADLTIMALRAGLIDP